MCVCLRRTISYLTNLFSTHTHTHTWTETERSYSFFSFFFLFVCVSCGKTSSIRLLPLLVFIQTDKGVEERDDHCSEFFTRPTRHLATDTALLKYVSIVNLFQLFTASLTLLCFFSSSRVPLLLLVVVIITTTTSRSAHRGRLSDIKKAAKDPPYPTLFYFFVVIYTSASTTTTRRLSYLKISAHISPPP